MPDDLKTPDQHPWYGPCDGLRPDGSCAECFNVRAVRSAEAIVTKWEAKFVGLEQEARGTLVLAIADALRESVNA